MASIVDGEDRLLTLKDVMAITQLSKPSLYRQIQEGSFPKPLKIGRRSSRWRASDIDHWLEGLSSYEGL
ncbi:MAG: AlpA family transcriptional regulator [Chloroflexi bacterium]|nr:AlpA family transcriptional regulator [Chloroflexota bacterium]